MPECGVGSVPGVRLLDEPLVAPGVGDGLVAAARGVGGPPLPTKTESVPLGEMGATDGEESTGAPALYGQPATPVPLLRWYA